MKKKEKALLISISIFILFFILQIIYLFSDLQNMLFISNVLRPIYLSIIAIIILIIIKKEYKNKSISQLSFVAAIISIIIYILFMGIIGYIFGFAGNRLVSNWAAIEHSITGQLIPFIAIQVIIFKIITISKGSYFYIISILLIISSSFLQLRELRILLNSNNPDWIDFFYQNIVFYLSSSFLSIFIASKGSFFALILLTVFINLFDAFSPILPNIDRIFFSLFSSFIVFIIIGIYHFLVIDNKEAINRNRINKKNKYNKKRYIEILIFTFIFTFIILFNNRIFNFYSVIILTGSMEPTISAGSFAIASKINPYNLEIGDIIHFEYNSIEFVHRIVDFSYNPYGIKRFITQGDANNIADDWYVYFEQIIGIINGYIPYIGIPYISIIRNLNWGF